MHTRSRRFGSGRVTRRAGGVLLGAALALVAAPAVAARFLVDTSFDLLDDAPGDGVCATSVVVGVDPPHFEDRCSLRGAIQEANALPGDDTVLLRPDSYLLTRIGSDEDGALTGDLDISDDLEIEGGWPCETTSGCIITGPPVRDDPQATVVGWGDAVAEADRDRVFDVFSPGTSSLNLLTVRGGRAPIGAGVRSGLGTLEIVSSVVRDNVADEPGAAPTTLAGAGVNLDGGTVRVYLSQIVDNEVRDPFGASGTSEGGGIRNRGGTLWLWWSTVARNVAGDRGGAVSNGGLLIAVDSTLSGNAADQGGALFQTGASALGLLSHVTITDNDALDGGGLFVTAGAGDVHLRGTILAGNRASPGEPDCAATDFIRSDGYNVLGEIPLGTPCNRLYALVASQPPGDVSEVDPLLGALADNGAPTPTHLPLAGSPAIDRGPAACLWTASVDAGGAAVGLPLTTDQSFVAVRPADGDGDGEALCDAGSVEFVPEPSATAAAFAAALALALLMQSPPRRVNLGPGFA